ncbi:MAG TPA: hypothetical protein DCM05_16580 [Elusimicrobia bacterium]|nr:hypothetical protein [Elusimicrobiota bacterium]
MKDKVELLMEETACDRETAELALQLCSYDLETAVQTVPRLFQDIRVIKGRLRCEGEPLYGLWLAILNLRDRSLLRARAVVSCNPAVFASELDQHWFDFEGRIYACRLWAGTLQDVSQEAEKLLESFFNSAGAAAFYEEKARLGPKEWGQLKELLSRRLGELDIQASPEVLDMGQFQEVRPLPASDPGAPREARAPQTRRRTGERPARSSTRGPLVLRIALEPSPAGLAAGELRAGDVVFATITDPRDVAQYLAKLLGTRVEDGAPSIPAPVEALERGQSDVLVRVRFSAGLCGDVSVPPDIRLKVSRRPSRMPWWKKIFGG